MTLASAKLPRMSRPEIFWLAFLWLADQWRQEQIRAATEALFNAYGKADRLRQRSMRPSPFLKGLL